MEPAYHQGKRCGIAFSRFVCVYRLTLLTIVLRTTARASNLTVILFGATLSVVLSYALATELFARNSPTVLYGDACDRIRDSSAVCSKSRVIHELGSLTSSATGENSPSWDAIFSYYPADSRSNSASQSTSTIPLGRRL